MCVYSLGIRSYIVPKRTRELQVGWGLPSPEKEVKLTSFSGHNAPSRSVALHGVGEKTAVLLAKDAIRIRGMRRRAAMVYSDSVVAAMERGLCGKFYHRVRQSLV